jgi:hypothetical protein
VSFQAARSLHYLKIVVFDGLFLGLCANKVLETIYLTYSQMLNFIFHCNVYTEVFVGASHPLFMYFSLIIVNFY